MFINTSLNNKLSSSSAFFYKAETEFRFYWKQSKFEDFVDMGVKSDKNPFPFKSLTYCACTHATIKEEINKWGVENADGLLFYHKNRIHLRCNSPGDMAQAKHAG